MTPTSSVRPRRSQPPRHRVASAGLPAVWSLGAFRVSLPPPACRTRGGEPDRRRLRPVTTRIPTTAGLPVVEGRPGRHQGSTPRGDLRRRPDDGVAGSGGAGRTRWASSPPQPEGLLVLIPPGEPQNSAFPPACRWEAGPDRNEDPHLEATRGVGPVTGTAGSESRCGRGGRHHFRLKAEGPFRSSYLLKGPSP